ncbi:hypothetical protein RUND412_002392 [Rhizina undulata]
MSEHTKAPTGIGSPKDTAVDTVANAVPYVQNSKNRRRRNKRQQKSHSEEAGRGNPSTAGPSNTVTTPSGKGGQSSTSTNSKEPITGIVRKYLPDNWDDPDRFLDLESDIEEMVEHEVNSKEPITGIVRKYLPHNWDDPDRFLDLESDIEVMAYPSPGMESMREVEREEVLSATPTIAPIAPMVQRAPVARMYPVTPTSLVPPQEKIALVAMVEGVDVRGTEYDITSFSSNANDAEATIESFGGKEAKEEQSVINTGNVHDYVPEDLKGDSVDHTVTEMCETETSPVQPTDLAEMGESSGKAKQRHTVEMKKAAPAETSSSSTHRKLLSAFPISVDPPSKLFVLSATSNGHVLADIAPQATARKAKHEAECRKSTLVKPAIKCTDSDNVQNPPPAPSVSPAAANPRGKGKLSFKILAKLIQDVFKPNQLPASVGNPFVYMSTVQSPSEVKPGYPWSPKGKEKAVDGPTVDPLLHTLTRIFDASQPNVPTFGQRFDRFAESITPEEKAQGEGWSLAMKRVAKEIQFLKESITDNANENIMNLAMRRWMEQLLGGRMESLVEGNGIPIYAFEENRFLEMNAYSWNSIGPVYVTDFLASIRPIQTTRLGGQSTHASLLDGNAMPAPPDFNAPTFEELEAQVQRLRVDNRIEYAIDYTRPANIVSLPPANLHAYNPQRTPVHISHSGFFSHKVTYPGMGMSSSIPSTSLISPFVPPYGLIHAPHVAPTFITIIGQQGAVAGAHKPLEEYESNFGTPARNDLSNKLSATAKEFKPANRKEQSPPKPYDPIPIINPKGFDNPDAFQAWLTYCRTGNGITNYVPILERFCDTWQFWEYLDFSWDRLLQLQNNLRIQYSRVRHAFESDWEKLSQAQMSAIAMKALSNLSGRVDDIQLNDQEISWTLKQCSLRAGDGADVNNPWMGSSITSVNKRYGDKPGVQKLMFEWRAAYCLESDPKSIACSPDWLFSLIKAMLLEDEDYPLLYRAQRKEIQKSNGTDNYSAASSKRPLVGNCNGIEMSKEANDGDFHELRKSSKLGDGFSQRTGSDDTFWYVGWDHHGSSGTRERISKSVPPLPSPNCGKGSKVHRNGNPAEFVATMPGFSTETKMSARDASVTIHKRSSSCPSSLTADITHGSIPWKDIRHEFLGEPRNFKEETPNFAEKRGIDIRKFPKFLANEVLGPIFGMEGIQGDSHWEGKIPGRASFGELVSVNRALILCELIQEIVEIVGEIRRERVPYFLPTIADYYDGFEASRAPLAQTLDKSRGRTLDIYGSRIRESMKAAKQEWLTAAARRDKVAFIIKEECDRVQNFVREVQAKADEKALPFRLVEAESGVEVSGAGGLTGLWGVPIMQEEADFLHEIWDRCRRCNLAKDQQAEVASKAAERKGGKLRWAGEGGGK